MKLNVKANYEKVKERGTKVLYQIDDKVLNRENLEKFGKQIKEEYYNKKREFDKAMLKPIFIDDLGENGFSLSRLIRVTDIDKRHAENEVARGSIGFSSYRGGMKIITIFNDKVDEFGLSFYPDKNCEVYYVDPADEHRYIALDDYFNYLKVVRISELQKIAQDLGAKHFKVTYKEEKASFINHERKPKLDLKRNNIKADVNGEKTRDTSNLAKVEIAAEAVFPGKSPIEPSLKYFKNEEYIRNLIEMRVDNDAPLEHQKLTLDFKNSSGIKEGDAVKIDAALKSMKLAGNTSVMSEVKNEARRSFEYEIDF